MKPPSLGVGTLPLLLSGLWCGVAVAQSPIDTLPRTFPHVVELGMIGSDSDDRMRTAQLLGETPPDGLLIRSTSSLTPRLPDQEGWWPRWAVIAPVVGVTWNSEIPFTLGEGPVWAGRGFTTQAVGGVQAEWGVLRLLLAPRISFTQNRDFALLPEMEAAGTFRPPWRKDWVSLDAPPRFGTEASTRVSAGESSISVVAGPLTIGFGTESQWWGPGIRNAIVMSDNALEIPHFVLRSSAPLRTRIGTLEAAWTMGRVEESPYFDTIQANDRRLLGGFVATLRPAWEPNLSLGLARTVYDQDRASDDWAGYFFDVLGRWASDDEEGFAPGQITSVFGRWIFPGDGLEVYAEWARHVVPESFEDLLVTPGHTQGYTMGLQWIRPVFDEGHLRLQSELTYLEYTASSRGRSSTSFYTHRTMPQGYTHRGRVIGAAIGPGASSQWVAADYLRPTWRAGLFGGRVRWDNDAYYFRTTPWGLAGHDVSVFGGVRGSYAHSRFRLDAEYIREERLNYLFQNRGTSWETTTDAVDVQNHVLRLTLTPLVRAGTRTAGGSPPPQPGEAIPLPPETPEPTPDSPTARR